MFSIFESCNSILPETGCFDVIHEEIMQIDKARHLKTCEEFGKIKNEDLRGLRRHYRGRNSIPRSQDILYGSKHPK